MTRFPVRLIRRPRCDRGAGPARPARPRRRSRGSPGREGGRRAGRGSGSTRRSRAAGARPHTRSSTIDPADVLHGRAGAHLIRHGADAADPGRDVGGLGEMPSDQQGFEVTGGSKISRATSVTGRRGRRPAVSLRPRPVTGPRRRSCGVIRSRGSCASSGAVWLTVRPKVTGTGPPWAEDSSRKAGAPALKVANRRDTSTGAVPLRRSCAASDAVLAVSAGPKQPKQPRPTVGHRAPHPGPGDRTQTGGALGHQQADRAPALALLAHRVTRNDGRAASQGGGDAPRAAGAGRWDSRAARSRPRRGRRWAWRSSSESMYSGWAYTVRA